MRARAHLWDLRGLATAGAARDHCDIASCDGLEEGVARSQRWQLLAPWLHPQPSWRLALCLERALQLLPLLLLLLLLLLLDVAGSTCRLPLLRLGWHRSSLAA